MKRFSELSVNKAWIRQRIVQPIPPATPGDARCLGCGKTLIWSYRDRKAEGGWSVCQRDLDRGYVAENCVILCTTEPNCYGNKTAEQAWESR